MYSDEYLEAQEAKRKAGQISTNISSAGDVDRTKHLTAKSKALKKMAKAPTKKEIKKFNREQPEDYRYKHLQEK